MKITDEDAAREVISALREAWIALERSVIVVDERCDIAEAKVYRQQIGNLFYEISVEMMAPIYAEHPAIRPEGWGEESALSTS